MSNRHLIESNTFDNWHASWQKHRGTNAKQRGKQERRVKVREGEWGKHTHPNTKYISAPLFPEPKCPEVILAATARNFPQCICFAHFMTIIFPHNPCKISLMINGCSWRVWAKGFFFFLFSFPRSFGWESMRHFTCCCVAVCYMFDMSRFVRD